MMEIFLVAGFSIFVFLGIFMAVIPMLPALFYMLVMTGIFSVLTGFVLITPWQLATLGAIFAIGFFNDFFSGILGAKWSGASKKAMLYGIIGLVVGTLILPPFGGIVGLFAGVLFAELLLGKSHQKAFKSASGSLIGAVAGMLINLILAITFFILFLIFVLI